MNKKIESIACDKTIIATIVDDSKADKGIYTVVTDNAKFVAYSDIPNAYRTNDPVMVTIPLGDYSQQKIICGKYVDNTNTPMAYTSPFQQLIDISNNLIQGEVETTYWANEVDIWEDNTDFTWDISQPEFQDSYGYSKPNTLGLIWDSGNIMQQGYTRLGLSAQFSTWLSEYETIQGNYGLAIELTFKCIDFPDPVSPSDPKNTFVKIITFDSDEFFGDVYNFETFYTQEKVYDISDYVDYPITRVRLFAYERDNFRNNYGENIYVDVAANIASGMITINPNIAIKDPYICLGVPVEDFESDTAEIFTASSSTYKKYTEGNLEDRDAENHKEIILRWVHKYETNDTVKVVSDADFPKNYEVRWYRFKLGAKSDQFARADWEPYLQSIEGDSDTNTTNQLCIDFYPDVNTQESKIKAVVIKNEAADIQRLVAQSNFITFTNEDEVRSEATLIDANALSIKYEDHERGHYFLYDEAGDICKNEDAEVRKLTAVFSRETDIVADKPELNVDDCSFIRWTFPSSTDNTMIVPMDGTEAGSKPARWDSSQQCWVDSQNHRLGEMQTQVGYTIKKHLNNVATQNTIRLEVIRDGMSYTAQIQPIFGTAGTNGSDYTLVLTWHDDNNAFDIGTQNFSLVGELALYDQSGDLTDWPQDAEVQCSWYVAEVFGSTTTKIKQQEEKEVFYPVFKNTADTSKSLFDGAENGIADPNYQSGEFYYFQRAQAIQNEDYYRFDLDSNNFVQAAFNDPQLPQQQLYLKGKKNKLEFKRVTFTEEPLNQETGIITYHNQPIYYSNGNKVYGYSQQKRYFIKYKDRYILDPWDDYQEVETYYEPIEAKESVYQTSVNGTTIGGLRAAVDTQNPRLIRITSTGTVDINSLFILQVTLTNFGDYDLVTYYPIPLKDNGHNFIVDYIEGPDRVRYDASGKVSYNKNPYQITARKIENNELKTYRRGYPPSPPQDEPGSYTVLNGYWQLLIMNSSDPFRPKLDETTIDSQTGKVKEVVNGQYDKPILFPSSVYIPDTTPYGVQFVYQPDSNSSHDIVLWTQPILAYESRYPSRTINKWDGKEILTDNNTGTITASGFAAGKKEREDNSFTGVMIGDWSRSVADTVITKNTGVYGFNHGAMAYAFKDDGTGFIGKDGSGRIYFDGGKAQIFSSNWTNIRSPQGMLLDIDDGYIKMQSGDSSFFTVPKTTAKSYFITLRYNASTTKKLYVLEDSNYVEVSDNASYSEAITYYKQNSSNEYVELNHDTDNIEKTYFTRKIYGTHASDKLYTDNIGTEVAENATYNSSTTYYSSTGTGEKYITIGSNQHTYPLSIGTTAATSGRNFRVSWDGKAYITDGDFSGVINAKGGSIDGDFQIYGTLSGGTITGANISGATVSGGTISGSTISGAYITADYLSVNLGYIGGWSISSTGLTGGSTTLYSNGLIQAQEIRTNLGNIGGWTISTLGLSSSNNSTKLDPTNGITTNTIHINDTTNNVSADFGYFTGLTIVEDDQEVTTHLVGMKATGNHGMAFEVKAGQNIRLSGTGSGNKANAIYLQAEEIRIDTNTGTGEHQGVFINNVRLGNNQYAKFAPDSMNSGS